MRLSDGNLAKAAMLDPNSLRRMCVWLGSRFVLSHGERELLNRATDMLTIWSDDETDPAYQEDPDETVAFCQEALDSSDARTRWRR